jgi:hypothetical protein
LPELALGVQRSFLRVLKSKNLLLEANVELVEALY